MKKYKPIINKTQPNFEREDLNNILEYGTGMITDVMGRKNGIYGLTNYSNKTNFVGEAVTVDAMPGCNLMVHMALDMSFKGAVIVVDGKGDVSTSIFGGIQAYYSLKKKLSAVVINGAIRDVEEIEHLDIPIYAKSTSPVGPNKGWGDAINVPVSCSGAVIHPGDILVGDKDGIAVIPNDRFNMINHLCQDKKEEEVKWKKCIDGGKKLIEILKLEEDLKKFGINLEIDTK